MTLKARFAVSVLFVVIGVLLSAFGTLYYSERQNLLKQLNQQGLEATLRIASVCEEALSSQSDLVALNYFKVWKRSAGTGDVVLLKSDGTVYLHSDMLKGDAGAVGKKFTDPFAPLALAADQPIQQEAGNDGDRWLRFASPVTVFGKRFGSVVVFFDLYELQSLNRVALDAMAQRMLPTAGGALALALLLSLWLAYSLNKPVEELVEGARRIGAGDFRSDIPVRRKDELGKLAAEFNAMARKLKELDQLKDRFLQSVSHEMRAPLSVMASAIYHAQKVLPSAPPDGLPDDLTQIDRGVERLTGFVDNILNLARLQAGRITFHFEAVDPQRVLEEARGLFARRAEEFGIRLVVAEAEPGRPIKADPARLQQVVANLILNAFKFTPDNGTVTLKADGNENECIFSVSDTGPGIPASAVPNLFERFGVSEPAPNPRKLPSSGLGLSICKEIVEAHGGRIWAKSVAGGGSTFHFSIPRWRGGGS